jgi:dolichyl-diphosphooligosaccharide--protein glycosyltransferase
MGRGLLVYVVAVLLRLRNFREVLVGNRVLLGFDDPYYHLRRVILTLQHFPRVNSFDYYLNFPDGAVLTWPPGFDLLVATVCWIAGFGHPSQHRIEAVAAVLIPFLGGLTALVVLLVGEEIFGRARWEAFFAALLFAFLPAHQAISTVGRLDHHVLELTVFGTVLLFFLRALRDDPGSRYSFWGGLALAGGTFCWTGAFLYGGFLMIFAVTQMILDRLHGRTESSAGRSALRVLFWGTLLLVPLVLIAPGVGRTSFTYVLLSWYQPALLAVATFFLLAISEVIFARGRRLAALRASGGIVAAGALVAAGVFVLIKGSGGLEFLTRHDPLWQLIVELTPAWKLPPGQLVTYFSPLLYAAPVVAILLARYLIRDRFHDVRLNALLAWLLFTALLGAQEARFLNYFAAPFCLTLLWAFRRGLTALLRRLKGRVVRTSAITAATILFVLPLGPMIKDSFHSLPGNMDEGLIHIYPTLEWMRDKTPRTSYLLEPERKPEYGVLSDFTFGHWVTSIGERPNFANPFGIGPWHGKAVRESAAFYLMEDEAPLLKALDKDGIRYVLLYNSENAIADYALLTQRSLDDYLAEDPTTHRRVPTQHFFHTLAVRLALADGSEFRAAGETIPALEGFRLVHESPETRPRHVPGMGETIQASYVKLFERSKGAVLEGTTDAGAVLALSMTVTTNTGRRFEYRAHATAGADGKFRLVVPYSSEVAGDVSASVATLEAPKCKIELVLTEAEVVSGAIHPVRCR